MRAAVGGKSLRHLLSLIALRKSRRSELAKHAESREGTMAVSDCVIIRQSPTVPSRRPASVISQHWLFSCFSRLFRSVGRLKATAIESFASLAVHDLFSFAFLASYLGMVLTGLSLR